MKKLALLVGVFALAVEAHAGEVDKIADAFNDIMGGKVSCGQDPANYNVVEHNGKLIRGSQHTWDKFKPEGKGYTSVFNAVYVDSKSKEVKPRKMEIKLYPTEAGRVALDLYTEGEPTPAAKYDVFLNAKGEVEIISSSEKMFQALVGKDKVNEGAVYAPSRIKVSKTGEVPNYVMDDVRYDFSKEQMELIKKDFPKGFFTDEFNSKSNEYVGVEYKLSEVEELAKKYNITREEREGIRWSTCGEVTEKEAQAYYASKLKSSNDVKAEKKFKDAGKMKKESRVSGNLKEESEPKKSVKEAAKAKAQ